MIEIAPQPVEGLSHVRARYESVRGPIEVFWKQGDELFSLDVTIPPNCRAQVKLPGKEKPQNIGSGDYHFEVEKI
jgi:alpha-L-rhamnosidase